MGRTLKPLHDSCYLRDGFQWSMNRAFASNFGKLRAKFFRDVAVDRNDAFETVDPSTSIALRFCTLFAILGMDFGVRDVDAYASERQFLVIGIKP